MLRLPVLGPGEVDPIGEENRCKLRSGIEARIPLNDTLFRQAERYFKCKNPPPVLDNVVDGQLSDEELMKRFPHSHVAYKSLEDENLSEIPSDYKNFLQSYLDVSRPLRIITSSLYPGMMFVPNPFTWAAQRQIVMSCFKEGINPPCLSNLDPFYSVPPSGLWPYMMQDLKGRDKDYIIRKKVYAAGTESEEPDVYTMKQEGVAKKTTEFSLEETDLTALELIRKLRWVTIGYQYDWTSKEYIWDASLIPFPYELKRLCKSICSILGWPKYEPEAGIINYYQVKDTLTGHVDRSEKNETAPLLSFSFGADAIFLLGGVSREDAVLPFHLRSGDLFIMSESCRRNYHGVPKIYSGALSSPLTHPGDRDSEAGLVAELMKDARLNLNVRQVFHYD
jgi:alkylated DNA repair protein alkB homolog 1